MKTTLDKKSDQFKDIDFLKPDEVVSSMECTGLIPTPPVNEDESHSYEELYPVPEQGDLEVIEESIEAQLKD